MRDKKNARDIPINFGDEKAEGISEEGLEAARELEQVGDTVDPPANLESSEDENGDSADPGSGQARQFSHLQAQLDALTAERATLYDQLLRSQAEFENYRKRVERERNQLYQRGRDDVLVQFLPVVDNFERALSSLETSEGDAEALRHGVELIHKQFKDALTKFGLEPVESVGHAFDPHLHEAVTTEATDKHKENTVIEEFQRGYKIGDRLLRPAKVKVASTPEK